MEKRLNADTQKRLKAELEKISNKTLPNSDAWEAYFNLSGFLKVLKQMKKEATYGTL